MPDNRDYIEYLLKDNQKVLQEIAALTPVNRFEKIDLDMGDGSSKKKVIKIFDSNDEAKWNSAYNLIDNFYKFLSEDKQGASFRIFLVIPDRKIKAKIGMVSLVIGKRGRQIQSFMTESKSRITVS